MIRVFSRWLSVNHLKLSAVVLAARLHGIQLNVDNPAQYSHNEVDTMITGKRHSTNKCLRKSGDGDSLI